VGTRGNSWELEPVPEGRSPQPVGDSDPFCLAIRVSLRSVLSCDPSSSPIRSVLLSEFLPDPLCPVIRVPPRSALSCDPSSSPIRSVLLSKFLPDPLCPAIRVPPRSALSCYPSSSPIRSVLLSEFLPDPLCPVIRVPPRSALSCYPSFSFSAAVSAGTTLNRSPTMPYCASLKTGASGSLLTATMTLLVRMPAWC